MGLFFLGFGPLGSNWQHVARDQPWVQFYFQVDLGTGAAVGGMQLEINTGYSCYLTAARRRRGVFFPSGSGAVGSAWRHAARLYSGYILGTFWLLFGYIMATI